MDSKTKHRILGVLVIIGLGVLAYPLLQNSDEVPTEKVLVKAPPFPDQSTPVDQGSESPTPTLNANPSATPMPGTEGDEGVSQQPDDTISQQPTPNVSGVSAPDMTATPPAPETAAPAPAPAPAKKAPAADASESVSLSSPDTSAADLTNDSQQSNVVSHHVKLKTKSKTKTTVAKATTKSTSMPKLAAAAFKMPRHDDSNGLLKLNQAAWVIQVGSFNNKASALRLVNNLRENGYRAFIQQVPSSTGDSTQVFVGPENRQTLARALATQLYSDMKVQGIVISYQPFAL